MRAIEAAVQLNYIAVTKTEFIPGMQKSASRMYPLADAKRMIDGTGPTWREIKPIKWSKQIMVGSRKAGNRRELSEAELKLPNVKRWLAELSVVNQLLAETCCFLDVPDNLLLQIGEEIRSRPKDKSHAAGINYSDRQLVRIFVDESFSTGGRLYAGWWQAVPDQYRRNIVINDVSTVEVDFSGIALRCLYARIGLYLPDDPYDIGLNFTGSGDPRRKWVKRYVNASLNDKKGTFRLEKWQLAEVGLTHSELDQRVRTKLQPIAHYFGSGVGVTLQFLDSEIAMGVLLNLAKEGIPCLPIHDSFIVQAHHELRLINLMQQEFARLVGTTSPVDVDRIANYPRRYDLPLMPLPGQPLESHLASLNYQLLNTHAIAQAVVASWYEWKRHNGRHDHLVDVSLEDIRSAQIYLDEKVRRPSDDYQKRLRQLARR